MNAGVDGNLALPNYFRRTLLITVQNNVKSVELRNLAPLSVIVFRYQLFNNAASDNSITTQRAYFQNAFGK